jgi:hypothetical protein
MSKIDNLALTLYNKDRHQLMKLYNNKRTSQLRKDIIREIFNQEGGEPFLTRIIDDEGNISFKKDITNEVKYISYIISNNKRISPYNKFRKINIDEKESYLKDDILLENTFLDKVKNDPVNIVNVNNDITIDFMLKNITKNNIDDKIDISDLNYIITIGIVQFDDKIYLVGYREFEYNSIPFHDETLNIEYIHTFSNIYIAPIFQRLSICKNLYYNNIKIYINDIYFSYNYFYINITATYRDGALACYDNSFKKTGFKYRLTSDIDIDKYNNLKKNIDLLEEPYDTTLYFRDLHYLVDTALKNCTLLKITLDKNKYLTCNDCKWYSLLYGSILAKNDNKLEDPWYYDSTAIEFNEDKTISETNFIEFAGEVDPKYIKIKSIITPTDIYDNKYNNVYILINKLEDLVKLHII